MIDYELAKKLKDAGFPQTARMGAFMTDPKGENNVCYFPTLSELVEACGEGFETLSRDTSTDEILWICNNYSDPEAFDKNKLLGWYEGKTPGEAVANLWLQLNKKS